MNIKMIVSDLDGTLLRTDKTISEYTKNIIHHCRNKGIKFAYATARGGSAERLVSDCLADGKIRMNGAVAKIGDKVIYDRLITYNLTRSFLSACDEKGMLITAESYGENYSIHYVNKHMHNSRYDKHQILIDVSQHNVDSEKIYIVDLTPDDEEFIINNLPNDLYFVMAREGNGFGMIMHKDATKAKAVSALADFWKIKQSEIVAFGDDLNDIDLLSFAGIGVAMENALDKVKGVADYICSSNDDDGVAKWIEENLLKMKGDERC